MAPSLMIDIGRAAGTDVSYQELVARHEHYSLVVQDGLVYDDAGNILAPVRRAHGTSEIRLGSSTLPGNKVCE